MTCRRHRARDVFHVYYVVLIAGARMAECGSSSSNLSSSLSSSTDIDEESQVVSILDRLRAPLRSDLARKRKLATDPPKGNLKT